jgi:hypothetical protein
LIIIIIIIIMITTKVVCISIKYFEELGALLSVRFGVRLRKLSNVGQSLDG